MGIKLNWICDGCGKEHMQSERQFSYRPGIPPAAWHTLSIEGKDEKIVVCDECDGKLSAIHLVAAIKYDEALRPIRANFEKLFF